MKRRIPTADELAALIEHAEPRMKHAIEFTAYSGLRLGELLGLTWEDISGDEASVLRQIRKDGSTKIPKYESDRIVVLIPEALQALPERAYGRVFPWTRTTLYEMWRAARRAAGVSEEITFHALRGYAATYLIDAGIEPLDVALFLGHKDGGVLVRKTYTAPSERKARDRIRERAGA